MINLQKVVRWGVILLLTNFISFQYSFSQQATLQKEFIQSDNFHADTLQAGIAMKEATSLSYQGKQEEAMDLYLKAINIYKKYTLNSKDTTLWALYIKARSDLGNTYRQLNNYDKSFELLSENLAQGKQYLGEKHLAVADTYENLGIVQEEYFSNYELAQDHYRSALVTRRELLGEESAKVAQSYENLGVSSSMMSEFEQSMNYYQKSLAIRLKTLGEVHYEVAGSYNNIGILYAQQGKYEKALVNFQKTLETNLGLWDGDHPELALCYNNLGTLYNQLGQYEKAIAFLEKAQNIRRAYFKEDHPMVAFGYLNLSVALLKLNQKEKALDYAEKGRSIMINSYGENHPSTGWAYHIKATLFKDQGQYEEALHFYQKALDIFQNTSSGSHHLIPEIYFHLGIILNNFGQFEEAQKNYEQSIFYLKRYYGEKNPYLASRYEYLGDLYKAEGQLDTALVMYQRGLIDNSLLFSNRAVEQNPKMTDQILSKIGHADLLSSKGLAFLERSGQSIDPQANLKLAYQHFLLAADWIDQIRREFLRGQDKQKLLERAHIIYNGGIRTAIQLYEQTKQDSFLRQAFSISEKSRSNLLLENFFTSQAKSVAGIPDSLLNREYELEKGQTFYEKMLFEEEQNEKKDVSKITHWKDKLFYIRDSYDSLTWFIKNEYPEYFRLKYSTEVTAIPDIQQDLLEKDLALLEYFVSDSTIYAFLLTKNQFHIESLPIDFPLKDWVRDLRSSLYHYHMNGNLNNAAYQASCDTFAQVSFNLYQKLIAPIKAHLPNRLIIVPDGVLSYVPFEVLLMEKAAYSHLFQNHSYLMNDHQISYSYSVTLLKEMQAKKNIASKGLLAFAPTFELPDHAYASVEGRRSDLLPLAYTVSEVENIQSIMGGVIYTGPEATESNFQAMAGDYRILHLATHSKANTKAGDYSFLAFTEIKDSLENERLYVRDLYNLRLNADMVVLSACETGLGELKRGEGIVSLARGFSYAGAKSMITSLWSVNDRSTSQIMKLFYQNLEAGQGKEEALRTAKLDYLRQQDDPLYAHPFYWAAFVAIGDMEPIESGWPFWYWAGLGLFLLVILGKLIHQSIT